MSAGDAWYDKDNELARSLARHFSAVCPLGGTATSPWLVDNGRAAFDVTLPDGRTARVTVAVSS